MPRRRNDLGPGDIVARCRATVVRTADLERRWGVPPSTVRYRCRPGGPWQMILPAVTLLHSGPPSRDDHRHAALLYAGDDAVLTGLDALALHGLRRMPAPTGPIHLLVPPGCRRNGAGRAVLERTCRLPDPGRGGWPLAPVARATLDFARRCRDRDQVRATIAEVVQRRRCTPAQLATELAEGSRRGSALPRSVLAEIGDGARSVAEAAARELILRSNLPQPLWNPTLVDARTGRFVAVPDGWFDEVGMAWEIDSREWHLSPEDHDRTLRRRVAMTAEGIWVVAHQPGRVRRDGTTVLDELARNYAQAARRPRPPVRAIPPEGVSGPLGQ